MKVVINSSKQTLMDKIVATMRKQKWKRSQLNEETCAYRSENGLKCAIGCLISDEKYDKSIEGSSAEALAETGAIKSFNIKFLIQAQKAHDGGCTPDEMYENFKELAKKHNLKFNGGKKPKKL